MKACKTPGCTGTDFYRHAAMADGYLSFCTGCVKERLRKQRATDPNVAARDRRRYHDNPARQAQIAARARAHRDPVMRAAHGAVRWAIKSGKLVRPTVCEQCHKEGFIEAAHYDYARPLDIRWLCRPCHRRWDSQEPKSF